MACLSVASTVYPKSSKCFLPDDIVDKLLSTAPLTFSSHFYPWEEDYMYVAVLTYNLPSFFELILELFITDQLEWIIEILIQYAPLEQKLSLFSFKLDG